MDKGELIEKATPPSDASPPPYTAAPKSQPQAPGLVAYVVHDSLPPKLRPHSFMIFSIFISAFCGFFNILTLFCTIPAIAMSVVSLTSSSSGIYNRGKSFGNVAAGLSVMAILFGMVFAFFSVLIPTYFWTYIAYCGFSNVMCDQDMLGRHVTYSN